jgi:hypothetical protein
MGDLLALTSCRTLSGATPIWQPAARGGSGIEILMIILKIQVSPKKKKKNLLLYSVSETEFPHSFIVHVISKHFHWAFLLLLLLLQIQPTSFHRISCVIVQCHIHLSALFEISLGIIISSKRWTLILALNIELDQKYFSFHSIFVPFLFCPCKKKDSKNCIHLYDVGVAPHFFFSSFIRLPSKFLQFFPRKFPKFPAITIIKSYHKFPGPNR